jgi:hypothetical protein
MVPSVATENIPSDTTGGRSRDNGYTAKEEKNILLTTKRRETNLIGHILRRKYLLKYITEKKVMGRRERRRKQLLDNIKEMTGHWKLKEETLDRIFW